MPTQCHGLINCLISWERRNRLNHFRLKKDYSQIPLTPESREKTAFSTPFGLFQFQTMPFGLHGAPATFQRLRDRILHPHSGYAAAYLNDMVIYSRDRQRHLEHVTTVLQSLQEAGLTENPTKCHLGKNETTYLGYTLGRA